jgi:Protein of unknown function (DUF1190)
MKLLILASVITSALVLSGCGAPAPKKTAEKAPVGVYTSASDCSTAGKLDVATCDKIIQAAVDAHNTKATTYISLRLCEATEGVDRCERMSANNFRPELLAFMVTFNAPPTPPTALPLYANKDAKFLGFVTADKKPLLTVDEQYQFSPSSLIVAQGKHSTK